MRMTTAEKNRSEAGQVFVFGLIAFGRRLRLVSEQERRLDFDAAKPHLWVSIPRESECGSKAQG